MEFSDKIIEWYESHKRDLPWRNTKDAYLIWLSEIILQQTKVAQGLDYFLKFKNAYPTVEDLAKAKEEQVLKLWQGLGYYNRARNLHFTAKDISENYGGIFPKNFVELKKLKGVGDYTAAAIASFCYQEKVAVVDGNVYRVLSRFFGDPTPIDTGKGQKVFQQYANELISDKNPDLFNQAIMEFGALQCTPKNPNCLECPFQFSCVSLQENKVLDYPVKKGKTKVRPLYITFFVLENKGKLIFKQRPSNGIWANMYDFPSIENESPLAMEEVVDYFSNTLTVDKNDSLKIKKRTTLKHKLSHKNILAEFIELENKNLKLRDEETMIAVNPKKLEVAIPRLIELFLEETNRL